MIDTPTVVKAQGLCNRIKTYMSLLSEHEQVNTEVFADSYIFPSIKYNENPSQENSACGWRLKVLSEEEKYIDKYKTIDFLYHDTPKYFIEKYLKSLSKIEINKEIVDYTDNFLSDWSDVIGVHIRSWWTAGPPRSTWHDNDIFKEHIDKFPDKKIFLCSDNNEVISQFKEEYGDRIITHDQKLHERKHNVFDMHHDDIQLITDGFIDCLLLSKCDKIIGTWGSTFSEVAWWLSGCNSEMFITKPHNVTLKDEADFFAVK